MATPTVTRPLATPPANTSNLPGGLSMETVSRFAKWIVVGCLIAGFAALVVAVIVYWQQEQRSDSLRRKWDAVYTATKDKKRSRDSIAALETAAQDPEIYGSPVHAYVLMELGNRYFDAAVDVKHDIVERNQALDKATKLFELLATQEPFKSNPIYGPAASQDAALAYEQARNYDNAIKILSDQLAQDGMDAHYLYNPMLAQLGRVYWLRSLDEASDAEKAKETKDEANAAAKLKECDSDRENARKKLTDALRAIAKGNQTERWRENAEYIKSLVDKPGKALPDGKAPPEKVKPADPKPEETVKFESKGSTLIPTVTPEKKDAAEPKKEEKKDVPKDDKKDELKKNGKESGSIEMPPGELDGGAVPASPSGHLTFAQIQKALKEGRPAFCQCPRCVGANAIPSGARIAQ